MTEIEYTMIHASIPLMESEELEALRSEMGRRHDETQEVIFAELCDECSYQLDWLEVLASAGMTEEEYKRFWE